MSVQFAIVTHSTVLMAVLAFALIFGGGTALAPETIQGSAFGANFLSFARDTLAAGGALGDRGGGITTKIFNYHYYLIILII